MTPLRSRLMFLYVGLGFLLLVCFSGIVLVLEYSEARSSFRTKLDKESAFFSMFALEEINEGPDGKSPVPHQEIEEIRLVARALGGDAMLETADGESLVDGPAISELFRQANLMPKDAMRTPTFKLHGTATLQGTPQTMEARITTIQDKWGRRFVTAYASSWNPYRKQITTLATALGMLILIGTVFSFLLARVYLSRALQPVQHIALRAEEINLNNLRQRIEVPEGSGEFSQLAEVINRMLNRIDASVTQLRSILSDVSHEVKTPLGNVRLWLEAMLVEDRSEEDLRRIAARALEEVSRTTNLLSNLLLLSQLQAGSWGLKRERVDLHRVTLDVLETAALLCKQKGVDLEAPAPGSYVVHGDADALRRTFANLMNNAIRHTECYGKIRVAVERRNGAIVWTVQDTGSGIPPEIMSKMFQRFNRGSADGTGMGMAICKAIVDAHAGTIAVESELGKGTAITISLPALEN